MDMTIDDIPEASPAQLAALPAETLMQLHHDVEARAKSTAQIGAALHGALAARYAGGIAGTGTHHLDDNGIAVSITLPKRVKWDQAKLATAADEIRSWGENPADYIDTEMKVAERNYDAWPPTLQKLFTPARTVETGKAVFKLAPAEKEAA